MFNFQFWVPSGFLEPTPFESNMLAIQKRFSFHWPCHQATAKYLTHLFAKPPTRLPRPALAIVQSFIFSRDLCELMRETLMVLSLTDGMHIRSWVHIPCPKMAKWYEVIFCRTHTAQPMDVLQATRGSTSQGKTSWARCHGQGSSSKQWKAKFVDLMRKCEKSPGPEVFRVQMVMAQISSLNPPSLPSQKGQKLKPSQNPLETRQWFCAGMISSCWFWKA